MIHILQDNIHKNQEERLSYLTAFCDFSVALSVIYLWDALSNMEKMSPIFMQFAYLIIQQ
jgi:hypothetical protein